MTRSPYPEFYIIGAAKAGTTSLVDMLRAHEDVWFPHEKEPHHFFVRDDPREWQIHDGSRVRPLVDTLPYGSDTAYRALYEAAPDGALRGDASTQYLVNANAAAALHAQRPDAKVAVVLRHPTDRAYSAYLHARSRGEEPCGSFGQALDDCVAGRRETDFAINYVAEGEYARHLEAWKARFGENLLVILFEDLISDPQGVLDRMTGHLGLAPLEYRAEDASHKNASIELGNPLARAFRMAAKRLRRMAPALFELPLFRQPYDLLLARLGRKPEGIPAEQRSRLDSHYAGHIRELERAIGRDLSHWRRR